jgi:hypothetical protein
VPELTNIKKAALILVIMVAGSAISRSSSVSGWKKLTSTDGGFSVLMPGKPKAENQSLAIDGVKMEVHSCSAWSRSNGEFTVSYVDAPALMTEAAGERMLDDQGRRLTQGDDRRMLSTDSLTVNGYSVRQYRAIVEGGLQADEKVYLVKRRLYILLVVHDRDQDKDDVTKFFGSFTFKP